MQGLSGVLPHQLCLELSMPVIKSTTPGLMTGFSHHPVFYFQDGSAIFQVCIIALAQHYTCILTSVLQVENLLYRLHMSLLKPTSIIFTNMFSIPSGNNPLSSQEGSTDETPIRLAHPFTIMKLEHLLKWFYR
jgi:hypothetical protein